MPWHLIHEQIKIWAEAPVDAVLNDKPVSVRLPLTHSSTPLSLFNSLAVETCSCEVNEPAAESGTQDFAVDTVFNAGGPVWTLDWCPLHSTGSRQGSLNITETLAVSTHPSSQRRNPIGAKHVGPGAVQLWAVPSSVDNQIVPGGLPKQLALLWHQGRLVWDLQWCPDPAAFITVSSNVTGSSSNGSQSSSGTVTKAANVPLQGILAAVLGEGDVVVWAVPTIQYLLDLATSAGGSRFPTAQQQKQEQQQVQEQQANCLSLQLPPLMQLASPAVGGSLASCCAWLPSPPHDQLLVGHWDGQVAIWQLPTAAGTAPTPVQLLRADPAPITGVAWQPNRRWWANGSISQAEAEALLHNMSHDSSSSGTISSTRHYATTSSIGNVKIWDSQDVLQPSAERMATRDSITSCAWVGPPHVVATASSDGVLRQVWLDAGVQAVNQSHSAVDVSGSCGCVWSLSVCEPLALLAFVCDGGLLGMMALEPPMGENRYRKSHAAVSAIAVDQQQLWLMSAREIPRNGGLYVNNYTTNPSGNKKKPDPPAVLVDPLPYPDQVLYSVKFSPNYRGVVMLAYGGGAGVVRIHTLSGAVIPAGA